MQKGCLHEELEKGDLKGGKRGGTRTGEEHGGVVGSTTIDGKKREGGGHGGEW